MERQVFLFLTIGDIYPILWKDDRMECGYADDQLFFGNYHCYVFAE